jgi:UDP-2,3-diacylglucosamine pyrophosphatase LpxH
MKILGKATKKSLEKAKPPASLDKDTILHKNWDSFKLFRTIGEKLEALVGRPLPVQVIYVPGNHDRLCNLYPALRRELSKLLGITVAPGTVDGSPDGDWWFKNTFLDPDHGVLCRHGHQFDIWNYGGGNSFTREGHLKAAIGDVFTTEFAVKIPWLLNQKKKEFPEITDEMVESTKDIDNVRPLSAVMEWIYYRIKQEDQSEVRKIFDNVFDEIVKDLLDFKMVRKWRSPLTHIDEAIRLASSRWLSWLPKTILDLFDTEDLLPLIMGMSGGPKEPEKDIYTQAAYKEYTWRENQKIQFILYGHTHLPLQRPLDAEGGREVFYINTGTWRNRIYKTVGLDKAYNFADLKQMTYSIFYRRDEDNGGKMPNTLSFDVWTGSKSKHYKTAV